MPSERRPADQQRPVRQPAEFLNALRPVEATRLADHVVAQVQDLVLAEGLEPGDRLPSERDLASRLGTSRAIVSQALRTLSLMGLVEVRPGSGAYVTRNPESMMLASLDLLLRSQDDSVYSLAELRYWLESVGARNALRIAKAEDVEGVEHVFERLSGSAGRTSEWIATDTMFHAALVRAAGNPYLGPLYESVHTAVIMVTYEKWVERSESPAWLQGAQWQTQIDLHRPIVEAMQRRDQAAMAAMSLLRKDFDLGLADARNLEVPMPISSTAHQIIQSAIGHGYGEVDFAALLELQAMIAGMELQTEDVDVDDGLSAPDPYRS